MYRLSLGIFRQLVRRRSLQHFCARNFSNKIYDDLDFRNLSDLGDFNSSELDVSRTGVTLTAKYITEQKHKGTFDWKKLINLLKDEDIENPTTKIFQACVRLKELQCGLDYYKYLLENGENLSMLDLIFFSKLLLENKHEIKNYEKQLVELYHNIKDILFESAFIRQFILDVFLEIPCCFNDIVENLKKNQQGNSSVIIKSLELNRADIAFEFMDSYYFAPSDKFFTAYINFCIDRAKEGKFSPEWITKLFELYEKQSVTFSTYDLEKLFEKLFNNLKLYQDEYDWSLKECVVHEQTNVCSECGQALLPKPLSKENFMKLKKHFFNKSFIQENVFLISDKSELNCFLKFLKGSKPYNVVFDILNLIYKKRHVGVQVLSRSLSYFTEKNLSVLLIGRLHSKGTIHKALDLLSKKQQQRVQIFFTSDLTEDDNFLLQAALHGGLGTCFLSGDGFTNHLAHMDEGMRTIFLKWQMTHQYGIGDRLELLPVLPHCGAPQLTFCNKNNKYIWHLSQGKSKRLNRFDTLNWFCLQADKKQTQK